MRKLKNMLFSMELTGMLLLMFAISIGYATFVENDFGTVVARAKIYNARWFELLLLLLAVNMIGSIFKHKMYVKGKWTILLFHVAFLVILAGSAVTRFIGFEGMIHIREGSMSDQMTTDETYITLSAKSGDASYNTDKKVTPLAESVKDFSDNFNLNGKSVSVDVENYYANAGETIVEGEGGEPVLWLVMSSGNTGRQNVYFREGEIKDFGNYAFGFNADTATAEVLFNYQDDTLTFTAPDSVSYMNMASGTTVMLAPDSIHPLNMMSLYRFGGVSVVVKQFFKKGKTQLVSTEGEKGMTAADAFTARITVDGRSREVNVYGGKGILSSPTAAEVNGVSFEIGFGAKNRILPFALMLNDFQLERYPGSNSPSSYSSEVTLIDKSRKLEMPFRIYMNHVLNYRGYRFFQSSYDKDEKGTILSVNHDAVGTVITYIGYLLLAIGFFTTIFNKNSRFKTLTRLSKELRESRKSFSAVVIGIMTSLAMLAPGSGMAQNSQTNVPPVIDKSHAAEFGRLLVQGKDGRVEPLNTLASEVLRKIARKTSFKGMDPNQVYLSISAYPEIWENVPFIKISNPELKNFLGVTGNYATFNQLVDIHSSAGYKIGDYVEKAYAKKASNQDMFDKEVMKVDERVNIFYMIYSGSFLDIFPVPGDENHKWVDASQADKYFQGDEALFVSGILGMYYDAVRDAVKTGDWSKAGENLAYIKSFQKKYGSAIMPSESVVNLEIFYNHFNIFNRLAMYYGLIGFILLVLHFINILKPKLNLKNIIRIASGLIIIMFLFYTSGLIIRWYISGHAPWSNGYESLIYIGWATSLSGLIFVRRSQITLAVTALLTSLILGVAALSWMDPEITNLVPVLKSYWLVIHVAIITASYGFLALGALLGFFNLVLMIFKTKRNTAYLNMTITELKYIIEMTLIVGLFMVTIGTFLGGVWANESWGRYWGWDPKETWALVTVLVYSFIAHMRFIPGFKGNFAYSFAALIGFSSVMMTYFGVNYYLSGLHSYAKGDPVPVPTYVYYTVAIVAILSVLAYLNNNRNRIAEKQ